MGNNKSGPPLAAGLLLCRGYQQKKKSEQDKGNNKEH
jgi:hypothetical protein